MKIKLILLCLMLMVSSAYATGAGDNDTTTLTDYITSFQARIISYSPNLWRLDSDSSEIEQAIFDAMLEVSKFPGATQRVDTTVMDSSLWYALPSDFQSMARVAYKDPSGAGEVGVDSILFTKIGRNTVSGSDHPMYYTVWSRNIYFDRNNYLLDTMYIYYNAYPATLDSLLAISNISKYYFNIVVDEAILLFYSGRVGTAVPQIMAQADRRLAREYAKLGIARESITPDVR